AALKEAVDFLGQTGRVDDAIAVMDDALEKNPLNREVLVLKMTTLADLKQADAAKREAGYLLALDKMMQANDETLLEANQRALAMKIAATGTDQ
ncbi:MAG TPA: hypothetical protein PK988_12615, partial [Candidatus Sumerlaeota bacterium]|nr:hypothetical protein [Candidatus Sumerlaeota bacterium]